MAFHIGRTVAFAAEPWERALAESAVSRLNGSVPAPEKPQVVADLLARLQREKSSRSPAANRSWPEHARQTVRDLLAEVLASKRRAELETFFRSVHEKALGVARKSLEREEDAQDAVADACLKILAGKSEPRHFFRVLRLTILDRLRSNYREAALFIRPPDGGARTPSMSEIGWSPDQFDAAPSESASRRLEERDPFEILLHRAAVDEAVAEVQSDRRRRGVKSRAWWKKIVAARAPRPETAGSNE